MLTGLVQVQQCRPSFSIITFYIALTDKIDTRHPFWCRPSRGLQQDLLHWQAKMFFWARMVLIVPV